MTPRQRTMEDVAALARIYRVPVADVMANSRRQNVVRARQAVMWMLRFRNWSYPQIGAFLHLDHATVVWGVGRHDERLGIQSAAAHYVKARWRRYLRTSEQMTETRLAA